ncbi:MAG TPA: hypothetical protein VK348_11315 [Planctomycetota bacterium]|nr:hypothetical protein [Planctomycetota bacterium]
MTKLAHTLAPAAPATTREPRPFLFLEPRLATAPAIDVAGRDLLEQLVADEIPALVRSLVNCTITLQNRRALESGRQQPIALSVLNRRRRVARAWLLAIIAGGVDRTTLELVSRTWLPTLASAGPDRRYQPQFAIACVEFVRGAITALIFDQPCDNLLPAAHALCALETVLAVHLATLQLATRAASAG